MKTIPALACCLATLFTGCASVKTLQFSADGTVASSSAQVDVLADSPELQAVGVSQYFRPGNPQRAAASPRSIKFGAGQSPTQEVSVAGLGKKALVIADLPGAHSDAPGDADSRRKTIPLSGKLPNGDKVTSTLRVNVSSAGLSVSAVK
jgi:hypothetical protein